jgi:hypothetical protein
MFKPNATAVFPYGGFVNRFARLLRLVPALTVLCGIAVCAALAAAQQDRPGHPIGKITTSGDLIVMELDKGALGPANLFDLSGRTLRFVPDRGQYRVENTPLHWDSDFGPELRGSDARLHNFAFPFSGKNWASIMVGTTGSLSFDESEGESDDPGRSRGVSIRRFDALAEAAGGLIDSAPAICVFFKPRMAGPHYVKELADRVVITWELTEPFGNIQDFSWFKTLNRLQAVLRRDGTIEMSYQQLAAKDAIVGVYPILSGTEKPLATLAASPHPARPAHLDLRNIKLSVLNGILLRVSLETRGPALAQGDAGLNGFGYQVSFSLPSSPHADRSQEVMWTAFAGRPPGRAPGYFAFGSGVSRKVSTSGSTITLQGALPKTLLEAGTVKITARVLVRGEQEPTAEQLTPDTVHLSGMRSPEVHLSSLTRSDDPFPMAYESFHYLSVPHPEDLACTVIKALGDRFDFLAYYSDFRIDNQEAGTPSDGPRGGNVTGIGERQHNLESYCSQGRFQWGYVQPVYVGSNQMREWPPDGAPVGDDHDITFYAHQLGESTPERKMLPYNYAMSQLGHEMGHRWGASASAKINGETVPLGPVHWTRGLHAPVAFSYQRPTEASAMGGSVWQDNFDGTFTQLDDDYYVPATGYSYLDLYLMGLISPAEVSDFFLLKNLVPSGTDANGHPIFKADRTKVMIQDVIAEEGPREPDVDHSQRKFTTGMVLIVEDGHQPSDELIDRTNGIAKQWIDYWAGTTGHRATMTVRPQ